MQTGISSAPVLQWHVIQTKPQQEYRASVEIARQDFEVFLPLDSSKHKPLFPRYLFARWERERPWGCLKSTRGVSNVLRNAAGVPYSLAEAIVEAIRHREPPLKEAITAPSIGSKIKVTSGPFQGFQGRLSAYRNLVDGSPTERTRALLEILGKPVEMPITDFEAA